MSQRYDVSHLAAAIAQGQGSFSTKGGSFRGGGQSSFSTKGQGSFQAGTFNLPADEPSQLEENLPLLAESPQTPNPSLPGSKNTSPYSSASAKLGSPDYGSLKGKSYEDALESADIDPRTGLPVARNLAGQSKLSLFILLFVEFLDNLTFSIIIPSLYPFIFQFNQSEKESDFLVGVVIAANSAATFIFSPIFGVWTDKRSCKEVLIITSLFLVGGNLMYGFATDFWLLLAGRIVVGIGAANQVVSKVYFGYTTTVDERAMIMGIVSLVQVVGIILGPAIAAAFTGAKWHLWGPYYIDELTLPGHFSAIVSIICIVILFFFDETPKPPETSTDLVHKSLATKIKEYLYPPTSANTGAVLCCIYLSFTYGVSFTVFETVGTPLTKLIYGWGVWQNGVLYTLAGVEAIVVIILLVVISKKFEDRTIVLFSSVTMAISNILMIPFDKLWGSYIPFPEFVVSAIIGSGGFTLGVVMLLTLFSRLIDGSDQGVFMGYFNASRALSRILAPLAVGWAFETGGAFLVFTATAVIMFSGLWVNMLVHSKMKVPLKADEEEKQPLTINE